MNRRDFLRTPAALVPIALPADLPSSVPQPGTFAEFTLNTPLDAGPGAQSMMLSHWAGGAMIDDYSARGGVAYFGGREHFTYPDRGGVLVLDIAARRYEMRCVPARGPHMSGPGGAPTDDWGAYVDDGSPQRTHTYNSIQQMPAAWGGGPRGSMVIVSHSGGTSVTRKGEGYAATWKFDLSKAVDGHSKLTGTRLYDYGGGPATLNDAPCTGIDYQRKGWWSKPRTGSGHGGRLCFTSHTGEITCYPAPLLEHNWGIMHKFDDEDLLVLLTETLGGGVRVTIPPDKPGAGWKSVKEKLPSPLPVPAKNFPFLGYMGPRWCPHPNVLAFVGLDYFNVIDSTHVLIWMLTPPPVGKRLTDEWVWSTEIVASADGSKINIKGDSASVQGIWGKLVYCPHPQVRSLVWTRDVNAKGQLIRLSRMQERSSSTGKTGKD